MIGESRRSLGGELKRFTVKANLFLFLSIWAATAKGQFPPAPGTGPGLPETIEAIESARITTRILYVTAHPDDESAAVLTYLARGLHADVALLSLTRGEGEQRDIRMKSACKISKHRSALIVRMSRHEQDPRGNSSALDRLDCFRQAGPRPRRGRKLPFGGGRPNGQKQK